MRKLIIWLVAFVHLLTFSSLSLAAEVTYYDTNNVGTPVVMWDSCGKKVWETEYYPFGQEYQTSSVTRENSHKFIGKEKDKETGLSYLGARYYDDHSSRFLTPDPVRPVDALTSKTDQKVLDNPQRLNRYAYGLNNPYRFVDPDGRDPKDPRTGKTNEVTRCHVETHNDPAKELIGVSIMATAVAGEAAAAVAGRVISGVAGRLATKGVSSGAENIANGLKLNKSLASEAQMSEAGTTMAGPGGRVSFRDAGRVAKEYGGSTSDWPKKTSTFYTARDGAQFETHWVENVKTGQRVEYKTKLTGGD